MTEVPDHLLQRSRERRAALGGTSAPAASSAGGGGDDAGDGGASTAAAVPAAAAAPAVVEYVPPPPPPPHVQAALDRKKLPRWMAGVGAITLLWSFIYAGVLFAPEAGITDPEVALGQELYEANCASCHGAGGEGGSGRPLADSVTLTFPSFEDHFAFVLEGSPAEGTPYGNPDRPGGQHIARSQGFGTMPAWGGTLTEEEIRAVVRYEREVLDHEEPSGAAASEGSEGGEGTNAAEGEGDAESGADSPTNEAESSGGDVTEDDGANETENQADESQDSSNDAEGDASNEGDAGTQGTETTP